MSGQQLLLLPRLYPEAKKTNEKSDKAAWLAHKKAVPSIITNNPHPDASPLHQRSNQRAPATRQGQRFSIPIAAFPQTAEHFSNMA
jgi:hypothetical protein